jgi:DNA-binding transcriptional MerR regulator
MADSTRSLSIDELAERSATPVRTIRFYITEGLLPRPAARGKGASYGDEHLSRLLLIRRLSEQRVPLAEIRRRLDRLSLPEIRALLAVEMQHSAELELAERAPSAKEYVSALLRRSRQARQPSTSSSEAAPDASSMSFAEAAGTLGAPFASGSDPKEAELPWRRLELAPGVELHVRADAEARSGALIRRLLDQVGND